MQRIVSAADLAALLEDRDSAPRLAVIDIRAGSDYQAGHIPTAISLPFELPISAWTTSRDDLLMELPEAEDLFSMLGQAGIGPDHRVVVVSALGVPPYAQAGAARVAQTLAYVGLDRVSILNGGFPAWDAGGFEITTEIPVLTPTAFHGSCRSDMFVDTEYVQAHLGKALIVDARDEEVYSGTVTEPWASKPGHIPTAVSLPALSIWQLDGSFRSREELAVMAASVLGGPHEEREIILYCGVGGYASSWLFLLTRVLGYPRVKLYDGSAQEWVRYHDMEM